MARNKRREFQETIKRQLGERVAYMYIPPERMMDEALGKQFASVGFRRATELAMRSTSPSQLKHSATVFVRVAAR